MEEAMKMSVKELREALTKRGVDYSGCIEKKELAQMYVDNAPKIGSVEHTQSIIGGLHCTVLTFVGDASAPKLGIILLHGYGANRHDLFPFIHEILKNWSSPRKPTISCLVPDAPLSLDGKSSRAWFPLNFMQLLSTPPNELAELTLPGLDDASDKVLELLDHLRQQSCNKVILSGFSQGAILSAHSAFRMKPDASIICALGLFSPAVQSKQTWTESSKKLENVKVLLSHGRSDPVIPFSMGELMHTILKDAPGVDVEFISFEGGHTIPMKVIQKYKTLIESSANALYEQ